MDIPGPLLTEARINTWLALHGFEENGDQTSLCRDRAAHRPSGSTGATAPKRAWVRDHSILLTWNGDWGIFTQRISHTGSPDDVAARLREHPDMQELLADFRQFLKERQETLNVPVQYAFSFEVSPERLLQQEVRVHTHLVLMHRTHQRRRDRFGGITIRRQEDFSFRGCPPVLSTASASRIHVRASWGMSFFTSWCRRSEAFLWRAP